MPKRLSPSLHREVGASLIEVLVAILLVALGILAMAAMQANSTRLSKANEYRAMGSLLVSDLADRMRANIQAVRTGTDNASNQYQFTQAYPTGTPTIPAATQDCETGDCNAAQMASYDLHVWLTSVAATLPGGWARVSDFDPIDRGVDIWLMWQEVDGVAPSGGQSACPQQAAPAGSPTPSAAGTVQPLCMYFRINL